MLEAGGSAQIARPGLPVDGVLRIERREDAKPSELPREHITVEKKGCFDLDALPPNTFLGRSERSIWIGLYL
jgi:hypothetical protein